MLLFLTHTPSLDMNDSSFPLGSFSATNVKMMLVTYMLFQVDV